MTAGETLLPLLSLERKVALVTGGSGGIGSAIVKLLKAAGATVVSVDRPGLLPPEGARGIEADLRDPDAARRIIEDLSSREAALDVLVHAAGITRDEVLWKIEDADWEEVFKVNLDSAFHLLKHAVPVMRRQGGGSVVLISSVNGERGVFGQANYAASKAGLIGLARSAACETGRFGIRVNAVTPGLTRTAMSESVPDDVAARAISDSPLGRLGEPEDVARVVLFLASPMSGYVTGQVVRVDGGQLIA
jgi:NAD(P)-dependent dehydrogenase (short-subunit alcohol dehydrogenase family)